jgi:hypothetical protein
VTQRTEEKNRKKVADGQKATYLCNVKRNKQVLQTTKRKNQNNKKITIMKKSKIILASIVGLVITGAAITIDILDEDRIIPVESLPVAVTTYVQNNYPNSNIAYAKKKNEIIQTTYKVGMSDGFELEFDGNGMLTDFDD